MKTGFFKKKVQITSIAKLSILLFVLTACSPLLFAGALTPIPEEDGFSGFINIGGGWMRMKSNTIAGTRFKNLSHDRINSIFDKPDSKSSILPMLNGELRYTFADTGTQLFIGNALDDWIRMDLSTAAGIRQQVDGKGIFEGALLFSAVPTEIWEDPYVTGQKREETDRTSTGTRLAWSRIFDSSFHATYSYRDIDVEDELSGVFLGLDPVQRNLLNREGDHHKAELLYVHQLAENQWLAPTFYYNRYNLDGDAMSHDHYSIMLTHTFATHKFRLISNLVYGISNYDKQNPIYQKTRNGDRYGVSVTALYPNLFKVENLTGILGVAYWMENANIDFYDAEIITVMASTMYRF